MKSKTISVIGLGYIGLPTAALLANLNYKVKGVDTNYSALKIIDKGKPHFFEPELENIVQSVIKNGFLETSTTAVEADIYIICVPTPIKIENNKPIPDINNVIEAANNIAPLIKSGDLIILESTSPVGTTEKLQEIFKDASVPVQEIHIAYCPERVLPGKIITELLKNDRVIGGLNSRSTNIVADFYKSFVQGNILQTNSRTAELCKLAENSFRDLNIAFANELSLICDKEDIDVWELINLANRHPRVNILHPGPGVGGHCIAIDPWFIVSKDPEDTKMIRAAREVNNYKTSWVVEKIRIVADDFVTDKGRKPLIACFGLSYKPDIDDLRESPALKIAKSLMYHGYNVIGVEPNIFNHKEVKLVDFEKAIRDADLIALLVKHQEFLVEEVKNEFNKKIALDFCGILV